MRQSKRLGGLEPGRSVVGHQDWRALNLNQMRGDLERGPFLVW